MNHFGRGSLSGEELERAIGSHSGTPRHLCRLPGGKDPKLDSRAVRVLLMTGGRD